MIEDTGASYEQQEKVYNQYKNKLNPNSNTQPTPTDNSATASKVTNEGQNLIDCLVSFKSIDDLL